MRTCPRMSGVPFGLLLNFPTRLLKDGMPRFAA